MSKKDLLYNEDFQEYQKDLERRLYDHVRILHKLLYEPSAGLDKEADLLMRLNTQRALIAEVETIMNLPVSIYVEKAEEKKVLLQKKSNRFTELFRNMFTQSEVAED